VAFSIRNRTPEPDYLVLIKGRVDDAALARGLQGKAEMRRIGLDAVLIGKGPYLQTAVTRLSRPPRLPGSLLQRGKTMAATHDVWFVGSLPFIPATAGLAGPIQNLALGLNVRDDLRLELTAGTATSKIARRIAEQAQVAQRQDANGGTLHVQAEGATLRLTYVVTGDQLVQNVRDALRKGFNPGALLGSLTTTPAGTAPVLETSPAAPTPNPEPARKTVVIHGLGDGPREIPLENPR
jgi:hypothetical protein